MRTKKFSKCGRKAKGASKKESHKNTQIFLLGMKRRVEKNIIKG
jgi:hypothetical protein